MRSAQDGGSWCNLRAKSTLSTGDLVLPTELVGYRADGDEVVPGCNFPAGTRGIERVGARLSDVRQQIVVRILQRGGASRARTNRSNRRQDVYATAVAEARSTAPARVVSTPREAE